jgi:cytochrome b subunit of formate dehydrogenase
MIPTFTWTGNSIAASQILTWRYLISFFGTDREVRACAMAIHGWKHCRFRFFDVDWDAKTIIEPEPARKSEEEE